MRVRLWKWGVGRRVGCRLPRRFRAFHRRSDATLRALDLDRNTLPLEPLRLVIRRGELF